MDAIEKEINSKVRKVIKRKFDLISEGLEQAGANLELEGLMGEINSGLEVVQNLMNT